MWRQRGPCCEVVIQALGIESTVVQPFDGKGSSLDTSSKRRRSNTTRNPEKRHCSAGSAVKEALVGIGVLEGGKHGCP